MTHITYITQIPKYLYSILYIQYVRTKYQSHPDVTYTTCTYPDTINAHL